MVAVAAAGWKAARLVGGVVLLAAMAAMPVAAAAPGAPGPAPVYREVLPNGLTLLVRPSPANDVVAVEVYLRGGVRYEAPDRLGVSGLVQRTLLKGTRTRSAAEIARESESAGAFLEALTGVEYLRVSLRTTVAGLDRGLAVLFDVLRNPTFPEEELERERQVALREIAARDDRPIDMAIWELLSLAYGDGHPYAHFPLGTAETLRRVTRDDVVRWHRQVYVPNNVVMAVVGRVDPRELSRRVRQALGDWEAAPLPGEWQTPPAMPGWERDLRRHVSRPAEAAWIVVGFPVPGFGSRSTAAVDVLANILGGGMSSRLFREVRQARGLAYAVGSSYRSFQGPSLLLGYLGTPPARAEEALQAMIEEFRRVAREGVSEEELRLAKTRLRGGYLIDHETNKEQASYLAWYELLGGGYQRDTTYPDEIDAVTAEQLREIARQAVARYAAVTVGARAAKGAEGEGQGEWRR